MSDDQRTRWLRFEIQHILPSELATSVIADDARRLLASINFNLESRGNKIALLSSPEVRDALRNASTDVQQAFTNAGFGWNTQDSFKNPNAHPEYNAFAIESLNDLSRDADQLGWNQLAKERAVFDLQRFMTAFNKDGSIAIQGTLKATFDQAWAA